MRQAAPLTALVLVACAILGIPAAAQEPRLLSIGTGDASGIYYYAGGLVCGAVNADRWRHGLRCRVEKSGGSIDNLRDLRSGEIALGVAQSDWVHHALNGTDEFEVYGPDRSLRAIAFLYPEPFSIVARSGSGINRLSDLKGKRVDGGPLGSGSRATLRVMMEELGWAETDFAHLSNLPPGDVPRALCEGDIDAATMVIAHPNLLLEETFSSCDATLVPLDSAIVAQLVQRPYYFPHTIPSRTYAGQTSSVPVFALGATLVTSSRLSPVIVQTITAALSKQSDVFRASHPVFGSFDLEGMATQNLIAPMHPGARRYFERASLLSPDGSR